jgi:hypothetical protein
VVFVVLLAQVELHACAFEDSLWLAGGLVDDGWNAAVGCVGGAVSEWTIQARSVEFWRAGCVN